MKFLKILLLLFISASVLFSSESTKPAVNIDNTGLKNWAVKAFTIDHDMYLTITATGQAVNDQWQAKAWILNAQTRRPVWEMNFDNSHKINDNGRRRFLGEQLFTAGSYEVYFGTDAYVQQKAKGWTGIVDDLFDNLDYYERDKRYWGITVESQDDEQNAFHPVQINETKGINPDIHMAPIGDNAKEETGFLLEQETTIQIYMVGEGTRKNDQMYDYGWITNSDTHQRVWQAQVKETLYGGGAEKNRIVDETFLLPAGHYTLHYITDDSHSPDMFNQMPPYDPLSWGISVWSSDGDIILNEKQAITSISSLAPIVSFTKMQNNEYNCEGFEIREPMDIYIQCVGEYSRIFNTFADYGWITNAHTRERIWTMTLDNSFHAGGSRKNRKTQDHIHLEPGAYTVHYITDDSHAFNSWNSSKPSEPEQWGITITPEDNSANVKIYPYSEKDDPAILASIKQVNKNEHRRKSFDLDQGANIRIYALGEGEKDEMYDYGWIENQDGDWVWEMEYDDTFHAGGARKNRLFNDIIYLPAGKYTVHYESDDSHNYNDWNADPPDDAMSWGITLINTEWIENQ